MKKVAATLLIGAMFMAACSNEPVSKDEKEDSSNVAQAKEIQKDSNKETEQVTEQPAEKPKTEEDTPVEEVAATPEYRINENNWLIESIEPGDEKLVLLTIDDAPDKYGVDMAKTLKELGVGAIFFVNGHFIDTEEEQARLKEIHEMGFPIGNHTYTHQKLNDVSEAKQKEEIVKLNDLIEEVTGERPKFFRAPHGVNTDYAKQLVKDEGMILMNWTYGYDYFKPYMDAEKLATAMVTGEGPEVDVPYSLLKPGANLLMHDREWTYQALPNIVKGLQEKGYTIAEPNLIETLK